MPCRSGSEMPYWCRTHMSSMTMVAFRVLPMKLDKREWMAHEARRWVCASGEPGDVVVSLSMMLQHPPTRAFNITN